MANGSNESINIIEAEIDHLDLIVPLFDQYRIFYGQTTDLELARRFIRARIDHSDSVIYLAIHGQEPGEIALGFTLLYPSFDSVQATPIWILNDLYVLDKARRKGLAKALIARGKELAEDTGARAISLATARDNSPSKQLYESLGFELNETFQTYYLRLSAPTEN